MEYLIVALQACVVIGAIVMGVRTGGLGLGLWGGASIPLVASLKKVSPDAAILLWGAEDTAQSRIHASDESVDPAEIERMITAQTLFIRNVASAGTP